MTYDQSINKGSLHKLLLYYIISYIYYLLIIITIKSIFEMYFYLEKCNLTISNCIIV